MQLKKNLENIYNVLQGSDKLLRLLHYIPKNASDDPLDKNKPEISELSERYEIIRNCLVPSDKKPDLDLDDRLNRICVYNGNRKPQEPYIASYGKQIDNNQVSDQYMVFDVYSHLDNDAIDYRLSDICDTVDDLIHNQQITDIGCLRFYSGLSIPKTPNGYAGMRLVYVMPSAQVTNGKKR